MEVPAGIISIWSGAIVDIPPGWIICNGAGGSPDLRDRFIVGAGTTYSVDDTGGGVNHNHDFTSDGHQHILPAGAVLEAGDDIDNTSNTEVATGTTDNGSSLPPYYALAYIMKT